ncbi:MAG: PAS domain S-box protein [Syntrophobacteraceae bacterium]
MLRQGRIRHLGFITFLLVSLTLLHYVSPRIAHGRYYLEIVFQRLYFLPIVLGCLWFDLRGGLITFCAVLIFLIPHLVRYWAGMSPDDLTRIMQIVAYFVIAAVLGRSVSLQKKELEKANRILRDQATLLDLAHDAIFVRGLDHTVKFWNNGAENLYGFKKEEVLGKVTHDLLHTVFPEPIDQIVDQVIKGGRWQGELRQTTSTGQEILVESLWALQPGEDGEPLGFLQVNRDVTAKKLAEEALRSNVARLELVNAELQEFAFIAAHDLQEPLRKIQTFCGMAQERCAPVLDGTSKDYLDRVVNSASRMRQLLRDLLDFSRVAATPEPFQKIDVVKIVQEAADVFKASIEGTDCQIEIGKMPVIEANEGQMLRLFQNLIGNALKFSGGKTPRITIYGKLDREKMCEIFVEDDGIGFDPKFAELIFKPFQRLHGPSEYEEPGWVLPYAARSLSVMVETLGQRVSRGKAQNSLSVCQQNKPGWRLSLPDSNHKTVLVAYDGPEDGMLTCLSG